MYDESTNTSSAAVLAELKREAYKLITWEYRAGYPHLAILADEYKQSFHERPLEEVAREFYNHEIAQGGQKINFIKHVRERFDRMDLLTAKMVADGFWARFYEKENQ